MLKAQLAKVKATIADKQKAMQALHQAAHEKGLTLNAEQNAQYESFEKEVEQLEKEAGRIEKLIAGVEKAQETGLTPANGQTEQEAIDTAEGKKEVPRIQVETNLPKGIPFAQMARAKMLACHVQKQGSMLTIVDAAKQLGYGQNVVQYIEKQR